MPSSTITLKPINEPWLGFLRSVDRALRQPTEIHCIGGFALLLLLERPRPTGDVDFIDAEPHQAAVELTGIAGRDSALAADHKIFLQAVTITDPPCDYERRLLDATPTGFKKLKIKVLDPYDLILTKLQRNSPKDRQDVESLIAELGLDGDTLRRRFDEELRPYLAVAAGTAMRTLDLWLEEFFPAGS